MVKRSLIHLKKQLVGVSCIALATTLCLGVLVPSVLAAPKYKEFSYDVNGANNPVLRVTSSDNKKWDTIESGSGTFWAYTRADVRYPIYVGVVGVFLGKCQEGGCATNAAPNDGVITATGNNEVLFVAEGLKTRDYNTSKNYQFGYKQLGNSKMVAGVNKTYKDHILDKCNAGLQADGPSQNTSFMLQVATTFGAGTSGHLGKIENADFMSVYSLSRSESKLFWLKVECEAYKLEPVTLDFNGLAPMTVDYLKVFLSTFSHASTKPKAGVQCKKGRALMRVKTSRVGPVKLKLTTRLGNGPIRIDFFESFANLNSDGIPEAEFKKWFSTTETTILKAKLSTIDPDGSSTDWKELPLHCSSSGGGGWAQPETPDPENPDPVADPTGQEGAATPTIGLPEGDLSLMDIGANNGIGPVRNGTAFIMMTHSQPESLNYSLKCSGDRKWYGSIKPKKLEMGLYGYSRIQNFSIKKTEKIKCVLRLTSEAGSPVLDTAERTYKVAVRPKGSSSGADSVALPKGPNVGDDPVNLPLKMTSSVSLKDNTANAPLKKPRYGLVAIKSTSNQADKVTYKLKCGPDRQWSGTLTPKKKGIGTYVAAKSHTFPVKKTVLVKCQLKVKGKKGLPKNSKAKREYIVVGR